MITNHVIIVKIIPGLFSYLLNSNGKSLAQRISGKVNIEEVDKIKEKYTEDAPQ